MTQCNQGSRVHAVGSVENSTIVGTIGARSRVPTVPYNEVERRESARNARNGRSVCPGLPGPLSQPNTDGFSETMLRRFWEASEEIGKGIVQNLKHAKHPLPTG